MYNKVTYTSPNVNGKRAKKARLRTANIAKSCKMKMIYKLKIKVIIEQLKEKQTDSEHKGQGILPS